MTDLTNTTAELYTLYTELGGTKTVKSFKNKQAILDAIQALKPDAILGDEASIIHTTDNADPIGDAAEQDAPAWDETIAESLGVDEEPQDNATHDDAGDTPQSDEATLEGDEETGDDAARDDDEPLALITEKLTKSQRARLRKYIGGKLSEGRWTGMKLPVSLLTKMGIRHKPA